MSVSLTDPTRLRTLTEEATGLAAQLQSAAPDGAQGVVASLGSALSELRSALEGAGYDLAKLPPNLVIKLQSPAVLDGTSRLDAAVAKAC
ncbi:MAG: hypothetical protein ACRD12_19430 [Acidimicrobiales bacterium]